MGYIINIALYLNQQQRSKADSVWWNYKRLTGFSGIKNNQVIVSNYPENPKAVLIKRCAGLPGDTLLIMDEKVYTKRREMPEAGTVKMISRIIFTNNAHANSLFDSLGLEKYHSLQGGENYFSAPQFKPARGGQFVRFWYI